MARVLGKAGDFVGGSAAALYSKDATSKSGNIYYDDGDIDPHYKQLYFDKYVKLDPSSTGHFFAEIEQPIATADLMPYDEFLRNALLPGVGAAAGPGRLRAAPRSTSQRRALPCSASSGTSGMASSTTRRAGACGSSSRIFAARC